MFRPGRETFWDSKTQSWAFEIFEVGLLVGKVFFFFFFFPFKSMKPKSVMAGEYKALHKIKKK